MSSGDNQLYEDLIRLCWLLFLWFNNNLDYLFMKSLIIVLLCMLSVGHALTVTSYALTRNYYFVTGSLFLIQVNILLTFLLQIFLIPLISMILQIHSRILYQTYKTSITLQQKYKHYAIPLISLEQQTATSFGTKQLLGLIHILI